MKEFNLHRALLYSYCMYCMWLFAVAFALVSYSVFVYVTSDVISFLQIGILSGSVG